MPKFAIILIVLLLASCLVPKKAQKKLPKCIGQYAHCWCERTHYETSSNATLLELYDDSTFQLAGGLDRSGIEMPSYFFQFKGKYKLANDSLFLDMKSRKHSYYELPWINFVGLPNLVIWSDIKNFFRTNGKVVLHKHKGEEKPPIIHGTNGYVLKIESGWYLGQSASSRLDTLHLEKVNYLPKSFFQKHKEAEDTTFYRLFRGYCLDSVGPRIDIMRFGRSYYPKK
jgi:hypothetical protein